MGGRMKFNSGFSLCIAHGGDLSIPSGGTNRITAFASGLSERGVDVTLIIPEPDCELPSKLSGISKVEVPVSAQGVSDQPIRALKIARRANQVSKDRGAYLQIEQSTLAGVCNIWGIDEYVLDMHDLVYPSPQYGDLPFGQYYQRLIHRIEGMGVQGAEKIIVVSEKMKKMVAREWDLPRHEIAVIPNSYFPGLVEEFRDVDSVPGRVVFFGTLHEKVDTDAIIEVSNEPEVNEVIVIGDGPRCEELKRACQRKDSSGIHLKGRLPDGEAYSLLASADVAINPQRNSKHQRVSCPVKFYYYAALGLPMIVTAGPGLADWFKSQDAAVVVGSNAEFPRTVENVLTNERRKRRLSKNARRAVERETWDSRVDDLFDVYDAIRRQALPR